MKTTEIRQRLEAGKFTDEQINILTLLFVDLQQSLVTRQYFDEVNKQNNEFIAKQVEQSMKQTELLITNLNIRLSKTEFNLNERVSKSETNLKERLAIMEANLNEKLATIIF